MLHPFAASRWTEFHSPSVSALNGSSTTTVKTASSLGHTPPKAGADASVVQYATVAVSGTVRCAVSALLALVATTTADRAATPRTRPLLVTGATAGAELVHAVVRVRLPEATTVAVSCTLWPTRI